MSYLCILAFMQWCIQEHIYHNNVQHVHLNWKYSITIWKEHSSEMWDVDVDVRCRCFLENWIDSYNDYEALNMAFSFDMFHLSAHQKWHKTGDEIKNKKIKIKLSQ